MERCSGLQFILVSLWEARIPTSCCRSSQKDKVSTEGSMFTWLQKYRPVRTWKCPSGEMSGVLLPYRSALPRGGHPNMLQCHPCRTAGGRSSTAAKDFCLGALRSGSWGPLWSIRSHGHRKRTTRLQNVTRLVGVGPPRMEKRNRILTKANHQTVDTPGSHVHAAQTSQFSS